MSFQATMNIQRMNTSVFVAVLLATMILNLSAVAQPVALTGFTFLSHLEC